MASGMAHEINNPLAIISAQTKQLKRLAENQYQNDPTLLNGLTKIEKTVFRISKIIGGLHAYSRNSAGDPELTE